MARTRKCSGPGCRERVLVKDGGRCSRHRKGRHYAARAKAVAKSLRKIPHVVQDTAELTRWIWAKGSIVLYKPAT
jgi:hypothetical protein